jgi:hypothetical protein
MNMTAKNVFLKYVVAQFLFWRWLPSGLLRCVVGAMSALMMEAESTSVTSVNVYQTTRRYNPEDSHLHTRLRENLKSHQFLLFFSDFLMTRYLLGD